MGKKQILKIIILKEKVIIIIIIIEEEEKNVMEDIDMKEGILEENENKIKNLYNMKY